MRTLDAFCPAAATKICRVTLSRLWIRRRQESFRVYRRGTAHARRRDGLAINVIRAVARHKHAEKKESG
jgi:hypothetical protein